MSDNIVWKIEDGETHWVVARWLADACDIVADSCGMTREQWESDHTPTAEIVPGTQTIDVTVTESMQARQVVKDAPEHADVVLRATAEQWAAATDAPSLLASTVY